MPRYFSNTLGLRTGRICTPLLSLSNSSRSPARKDSANFDGHCDLAFARDFSLLLHSEFLFLTLAYFPYLAYFNH